MIAKRPGRYDARREHNGEVYPLMWDEPDALQWIRHWYQPLPHFFAAAAEAGDSMIIWLS
jgi:hypothetical protein